MKIHVEIDRKTLIKIVIRHIQRTTGLCDLEEKDFEIVTKSKQNYKAEWENADYKLTGDFDIETISEP